MDTRLVLFFLLGSVGSPVTFLCWALSRWRVSQTVQGGEGYPVALWDGKGQRGAPQKSGACHSFLGGKSLGENPARRQLHCVHQLRHLPLGLLCVTQGEPGNDNKAVSVYCGVRRCC